MFRRLGYCIEWRMFSEFIFGIFLRLIAKWSDMVGNFVFCFQSLSCISIKCFFSTFLYFSFSFVHLHARSVSLFPYHRSFPYERCNWPRRTCKWWKISETLRKEWKKKFAKKKKIKTNESIECVKRKSGKWVTGK